MNKRFTEAESAFRRAMNEQQKQCRDNRSSIIVGLARTLDALGKDDEAESYYKAAVAQNLKPGSTYFYPLGHVHYGLFLFNRHRYMEAKEQYGICVKHSPQKAYYQALLGDVLFKLNDIEGFEYRIKKALDIDPHHPLANKTYQHYLKNKDQIENGKEGLQRSLLIDVNDLVGSYLSICGDEYRRLCTIHSI